MTITQWTDIGQIEDIPLRGSRVVETLDGLIAIFRATDNQVFALNNRCPHKGGPLSEGIVSGHHVACPLHNWIIDLESGEAVAPDVGCAPPVPVRIDQGRVYLGRVAAKRSAHG